MLIDQPELFPCDDEIDLRDVFAALQRRWRWLFGGGLLGLALAGGAISLKLRSAALVQANLIVDVAQGPCYYRYRQARTFKDFSTPEISCSGEHETVRLRLSHIASSNDSFVSLSNTFAGEFGFRVVSLSFDEKGKEKSSNQFVLNVTGPSNLAPQVSAALAQIKQKMTLATANSAKADGYSPTFGNDWIRIVEPIKLDSTAPIFGLLALGLLGGLVLGAGSGLTADWRTNRVYSKAQLLRRLGYPLNLGLPSCPWTSPAAQVLLGQLATQLDQSLSWQVLSIAHQHEAVVPLTQLLQQQAGSGFQCRSADPLLSSVLRFEPRGKPTGLLLVVEAGFNSARALEEARLLISQMSNLHAVGVVLIGVPLPEELSPPAIAA